METAYLIILIAVFVLIGAMAIYILVKLFAGQR
jgi:hypothetical protein